MRRELRSLATVGILCIASAPSLATDYLIESGDAIENLWLQNNDSLLMTGGSCKYLTLTGDSVASIEATEPYGPSGYGISEAEAQDDSTLTFSGGKAWSVAGRDQGKIVVTGGEFNSFFLQEASNVHIHAGEIADTITLLHASYLHVYGYNLHRNPIAYNNILGNWLDGTSFSLILDDGQYSHPEHVVMHEIPEPISLSILAGGFFLIRRNRVR